MVKDSAPGQPLPGHEHYGFKVLRRYFGDHPLNERPEKTIEGDFELTASSDRPAAMVDVRFMNSNLLVQGVHFFLRCTFQGGHLGPSNFQGVMLDCTFIDVQFHGGFSVHFEDCTFSRCGFGHDVGLSGSHLARPKGLETCTGLQFVGVNQQQGSPLGPDYGAVPLPWWCRWPSTWADLRGVGTLPFFGLSYAGVPLLLILISGIDFYNLQVAALAAWGSELGNEAGGLAGTVRRLHRLAVPFETALLLASGIALMGASTIYAVCCPSRIKEFSLQRWVEEFGKDPIHYLPLSWHRPMWRWLALALYGIGGVLAFTVLALRFSAAWQQLWRNIV